MLANRNLGLCLGAVTALADQLTKYWVVALSGVIPGGLMPLGPYLDIANQRNPGISYSLFELNGPFGQWLLTAVAAAASIAIIVWLSRGTTRLTAIALGLILGGAVGNAIDRPIRGGVVDWVSLHAGNFHWYVFNLADVGIVAGVVFLVYEFLIATRNPATLGPQ